MLCSQLSARIAPQAGITDIKPSLSKQYQWVTIYIDKSSGTPRVYFPAPGAGMIPCGSPEERMAQDQNAQRDLEARRKAKGRIHGSVWMAKPRICLYGEKGNLTSGIRSMHADHA